MSAARRLRGEIFAHSPFPQFREPDRTSLPLFPDRRAKPAPEPSFKLLQHRRRFALPEIADPAPQVAGQFFSHPFRAHTACPPRQFPHSPLEPVHRFRRYPPLWYACVSKAESQKLPLPGPRYRTLLLVHLELELRRDESRDALHHSFPGPSATDVYITIIRIPRTPKSTPL